MQLHQGPVKFWCLASQLYENSSAAIDALDRKYNVSTEGRRLSLSPGSSLRISSEWLSFLPLHLRTSQGILLFLNFICSDGSLERDRDDITGCSMKEKTLPFSRRGNMLANALQ